MTHTTNRRSRSLLVGVAALPMTAAILSAPPAAADDSAVFQPAEGYGMGGAPRGVVIADFNGDGANDMATANEEPGTVTVRFGLNSGGFGTAVSYGVGAAPRDLAVGDFNGDGDPDLVVPNFFADTVSVLYGQAGIGFGGLRSFGTGDGPSAVAVDDFNGDGHDDVAVANRYAGSVSILRGRANGTLPIRSDHEMAPNAIDVTTGDFDGDGIPDVAAAGLTGAEPYSRGKVAVRHGGSGFALGALTTYGADYGVYAIAAGDLDGDGASDLVHTNWVNRASVRLSNGDGTFAGRTNYTMGERLRSVLLHDFNADGHLDMVVGSEDQHSVKVRLGQGDGTFGQTKAYSSGAGGFGLAAGDLNGDRADDLAVANKDGVNKVHVLHVNAVARLEVTPATVEFGEQSAGSRSEFEIVTATNPGTASVNVSAVELTGADADHFELGFNTCADRTIGPDTSCAVAVAFAPESTGERSAALTFSHDGAGSSTAVSLSGTGVSTPPVAVDDAVSVDQGSGPAEVDVLGNDTDVDGGPMVVESVTQPTHGAVEIAGDGSAVTYAPEAGYCNSGTDEPDDTFAYTLNGGAEATVAVTVECADAAPVAIDDTMTVDQDSGAVELDVLANDTDADGGLLAVESVTQPAHGSVTVMGDGSAVTYEPEAGYCNSSDGDSADEFDYSLNGGSAATVAVEVTCATSGGNALADLLAGLQGGLQNLLGGLFGGLR